MSTVRQLDVTNWQRACPECGYQNGFHVSFHRTEPDEDGNDVEILLICPSCSVVFDAGFRTRLGRPSAAHCRR